MPSTNRILSNVQELQIQGDPRALEQGRCFQAESYAYANYGCALSLFKEPSGFLQMIIYVEGMDTIEANKDWKVQITIEEKLE